MKICQKCHLAYEDENFCLECGSQLVDQKDLPKPVSKKAMDYKKDLERMRKGILAREEKELKEVEAEVGKGDSAIRSQLNDIEKRLGAVEASEMRLEKGEIEAVKQAIDDIGKKLQGKADASRKSADEKIKELGRAMDELRKVSQKGVAELDKMAEERMKSIEGRAGQISQQAQADFDKKAEEISGKVAGLKKFSRDIEEKIDLKIKEVTRAHKEFAAEANRVFKSAATKPEFDSFKENINAKIREMEKARNWLAKEFVKKGDIANLEKSMQEELGKAHAARQASQRELDAVVADFKQKAAEQSRILEQNFGRVIKDNASKVEELGKTVDFIRQDLDKNEDTKRLMEKKIDARLKEDEARISKFENLVNYIKKDSEEMLQKNVAELNKEHSERMKEISELRDKMGLAMNLVIDQKEKFQEVQKTLGSRMDGLDSAVAVFQKNVEANTKELSAFKGTLSLVGAKVDGFGKIKKDVEDAQERFEAGVQASVRKGIREIEEASTEISSQMNSLRGEFEAQRKEAGNIVDRKVNDKISQFRKVLDEAKEMLSEIKSFERDARDDLAVMRKEMKAFTGEVKGSMQDQEKMRHQAEERLELVRRFIGNVEKRYGSEIRTLNDKVENLIETQESLELDRIAPKKGKKK